MADSILDTIVEVKRHEVRCKDALGVYRAMKGIALSTQHPNPLSMSEALKKNPYGIIAEFKRRSPSKGPINENADIEKVVSGYSEYGAAASSVLTDTSFFGGSLDDFSRARVAALDFPLLRKEFIVNSGQIYEARVYGANAILLIASILTPEETAWYTEIAHNLGMEVLLEIHNIGELSHYVPGIEMVGVNNRNLATFNTDIANSAELVSYLPDDVVKVAESGISSAEDVKRLSGAGFNSFLIGERFMKHESPELALKTFIEELEN